MTTPDERKHFVACTDPDCATCLAIAGRIDGSMTITELRESVEADREREDRLHQMLRTALSPKHTCTTGPVCEQMTGTIDAEYDALTGEPLGCEHESCWELLYDWACRACLSEDAAETAAMIEHAKHVDEHLTAGICPAPGPTGQCGADITCQGEIAAPGYGVAYKCAHGHHWVKIGTSWSDTAPELTIGDVI